MCKISTPPPGFLLVGPLQAPIDWLLFTIVLLVLLLWFIPTYTYDVRQLPSYSVRPAQSSLLIVTYALLLVCSLLVFIVAAPSLQILNDWFRNETSFLSQVCELGTDQYIVLNLLTAKASHQETYLGLLSSGGLIVALICMGLYTRSRDLVAEDNGQQSSARDILLFRNSILALVLFIATNVVYALSPVLDGAGCDEGCGFELLFIRLLGSLLGILALLVTLFVLIRAIIAQVRKQQWNWLVGTLLLLLVSGSFFLQALFGPGRLDRPYPGVFYFITLLNVPDDALVFTVLTFLPVALLLYALSSETRRMTLKNP